MRKTELLAGLALGAFLIAAAPAYAAAPAEQGAAAADEDPSAIVVTAQRREQKLQDVPLAVSSFSAATLQRQQVSSTIGISRLVPGLTAAPITGAGANNYSLRGLSNAATSATFDPPIATYVDEIYIGRINANNLSLFDVDRVEVLRGPQGTLFGRNTTGGAINIILKKPARDLGASVDGELGNYDHYQIRGAIDLPVNDKILTRIAAYKFGEDGWAHNRTTGGTNNGHDGWGVRAAATIALTDSIHWALAADYTSDSASFLPVTKVDGKYVTYSGLQKLGTLVTGKKGDIPGNAALNKSYGVSSKLGFDLGTANLELISAYRHLNTRYNVDYFDNPSTIGGYDSVAYINNKQFSQEIKLTGDLLDKRLNYTTGLFYFHEKTAADTTEVLRLASGNPYIAADRTIFSSTDAIAAYGQVDYHLTQQVTLTAGARLTREHKDLHYENNNNPRAVNVLSDATLVAAGVPLAQTVTLLTPRFVAQYEPTKDVMLFASVTRGFKSGGWTGDTSASLIRAFRPEKIWSYEGGARTTFLQGKATANVTLYYGDTTDLQISTAAQSATANAAPTFPTGNFSDFRSYGAEFEFTLNPTRRLQIFANAGYNKSNYINPTSEVITQQAACLASIAAGAASRPNCGAGIVEIDGSIAGPLRTPKYTGTLGFSWQVPVTSSWQLVPSGSVRGVSSFYTNSANTAISYDNGYVQLAGTLMLERADGRYAVGIGCENCNNNSYLVSVISGRIYTTAPRRWTVTAHAKF